MKDSIRESLSYGGIYWKMFRAKKTLKAERVQFGDDAAQHFLYYEPERVISDKVIIWVHGGGWNAGSPEYFDFVGQGVAGAGYRFLSLGYRLSPKNKYPAQLEDVCAGYKAAVAFLAEKGVDTSKVILSGSSAGAHLVSILCCSKAAQEKMDADLSGVIGFIGMGGPYGFAENDSFAVKYLLGQLFEKDYDWLKGEPCALMEETHIPMLLIQSKHDGLIEYSCAERFCEKALSLGNRCELYSVADEKNTHSWYTAGIFLETREGSRTLDKFFSWVEEL